ncbi:acyl-CoA desaturase-like [Centruroides sculpturatus]|uniref:acyl-CoA desaturase-like n=1 Tax=Centruroides sculpturatus TaxID=218467 RepID=UPI000C6D0DFC|nr:acyl-CoA desaturase-like [Centruroides sculpturatus]XP_023228727.1 acyl-CoA desaturase-like [Centruroides sculpturatus]
MAPRPSTTLSTVTETVSQEKKSIKSEYPPLQIVWRNVAIFAFLHIGAVYGVYLSLVFVKWQTWLFCCFIGFLSGLGITAGAHRLWCHRSYKAKLPLRIFLCICNCIATENDIYEWSRDHRVHHKYSETTADPHNVERGFFFSHIGWLLVRKHPDVIAKGKTIDLSDLRDDPVVKFQRRYYPQLVLLFNLLIPTFVPYWFWGESAYYSFWFTFVARYIVALHMTWLVNSAAHMWGNKPYDKYISARENNFVAIGALGEGFHNYHHTFPWDYSTSELGWRFNLSTMFIDTMAWLGLAYDLKTVPPEMIKQRVERTGEKYE